MNTKKLVGVLSVILLSVLFPLSIHGQVDSPLDTKEINPAKKSEIYENLELEILDSPQKGGAAICGFDVNRENDIAIAFRDNHIEIYTTSGVFKIGYRIHTNGSYQIQFDATDDHLMIYLVRSEYLIKIDEKGTLMDALQIDYTDKTDALLRELDNRYEIVKEQKKFALSPKSLLQIQSKLVFVDERGNTNTIYCQEKKVIFGMIGFLGVITLLGAFSIIIIVKYINKKASQGTNLIYKM